MYKHMPLFVVKHETWSKLSIVLLLYNTEHSFEKTQLSQSGNGTGLALVWASGFL